MDATSTAAGPYGLPYASATHDAAPRPATRIWAGAVVLAGALGLVFLAGCFMIGVMMVVNGDGMFAPGATPGGTLTTAETVLVVVLYAMAAACFVGAAYLVTAATRALAWAIRG